MKRLVLFLSLLLLSCFSSVCIYSLSTEDTDELTAIVQELKALNSEQNEIINRSQERNSELEKLSQTQQQKISELESLSEDKQKIIEEQNKTIDELKNSSNTPKKSSVEVLINKLVVVALAFFAGFFTGKVFF